MIDLRLDNHQEGDFPSRQHSKYAEPCCLIFAGAVSFDCQIGGALAFADRWPSTQQCLAGLRMGGEMQFRFLHAADLHLDSPMRGLSNYEGLPTDEIRSTTRRALDNLVTLAIERQVAFVIIAGDLYDGDWDDFGTGLYFCGAMRRLKEASIQVYLARGNHDAASAQTKRLPLPDNVHSFATRAPESVVHSATGTVLHGQGYKDRDPGGNLAAAYPARQSGRFNIGVLHTALSGRPPHAAYAPCTAAELAGKGYDYWALGHVHTHEIVSTDPYIVFPGNTQGRSILECGAKGVVVVTVDDGMIGAVEHVPVDVVRWAEVAVQAEPCLDRAALDLAVRDKLHAAVCGDADGLPLIARVVLFGETTLHGQLLERGGTLREEVRAIAAAISDRLWIEKVVVRTEPEATAATLAGDDVAQVLDDAIIDSDLQIALAAEFMSFFSKLPADLVEESELLRQARGGSFEGLLADAASSLKAHLVQERS
ncbi:MAG: metallophosphoesterase [Rhodospirillales bacterium]|nr:metallophosphoesterase [Rhodospirillales bacterium]